MLTALFETALVDAAQIHKEQERKILPTPYVGHLLQVCGLVLEYGGNETCAIAAILHDALEDQYTDTLRATLLERYGADVVEIIDACTDCTETPKPPWRARKEAHVEKIRSADERVALVVACDKLHSLRDLTSNYAMLREKLWGYFGNSGEDALWYYAQMTAAVQGRVPTSLYIELSRTLGHLCVISGHESVFANMPVNQSSNRRTEV